MEVISRISPHLYSDVRLGSGVLPVRYVADVEGADRGAHIVVAVNDVVAGSGIVTDLSGSDGISVLLDPETFVDGANRIQTFQLEDALQLSANERHRRSLMCDSFGCEKS